MILSKKEETSWPSVSVIVPVYNDRTRLTTCLRSLLNQSYPAAIEIIVVDNGSTDDVADLRMEFPKIIFLREEEIGSYNARNSGISRATGEILAFTDSDCEPDRGWIRSGVRALIENCNAAYVGGYIEVRLVNENRPNTAELYDYLTGFPQRQNIELRGLSATANLFAWRSTFDSVGHFNGALLAGGDVEWCRRALKKRGWPAFESRAIVRHPARTTEDELFLMKRRGMGGARDRDRSLFGCLVTILKQIAGLILDILSLFREKGRDLNVQQKLEVFAFSWRVRVYSICERIKFQNPRVATPRA